MSALSGKTMAVLLAKLHEECEFHYPCMRLRQAGATVVVIGEEGGRKYKGTHGLAAKSDRSYRDVTADEFDGVVIPGGFGSMFMSKSKDCLRFVRGMFKQEKLIAFIRQAGWVPISCDIIRGKRATSIANIRQDMINAGCRWEDSPLVMDGNMLSSRDPDDLPDFVGGILTYLGKV